MSVEADRVPTLATTEDVRRAFVEWLGEQDGWVGAAEIRAWFADRGIRRGSQQGHIRVLMHFGRVDVREVGWLEGCLLAVTS